MMDKNKLRALLYAKDKQSPSSGMPVNKTSPKPMTPGLPNPMGMASGVPKIPAISLPKPTAAPSLPKQPTFPKLKNALKLKKG